MMPPVWCRPALRGLSSFAVDRLAEVDYNVAHRVAETVAKTVHVAYENDIPWMAVMAVDTLRRFDDLGSILIALVQWLVLHTP